MGISRRNGLLRIAMIAAFLLGISWAALSRAAGQSSSPEQAPTSAPKVDWSIFLPAGEGQFQTAVYCSSCHTLQSIVSERRSDEAGWTEVVQTMVYTNDAAIEESDMKVISKYLANSFGPTTPKLGLPIHINTAPKEILACIGSLSQADVQKILDARAKEKVRDFAALEAIVGSEKVAKYKSVISFD
jgi:hypothetical protein